MFKTTPNKALPPMRAGERESRAGGEQYCLSPLPLPVNSECAVDVAHIDVRHDEATLDIRQGASPDSMMTAGHMLSVGVTAIMIMFLIIWVGIGGFPPDPQFAAAWGGGLYAGFLFVFTLAILWLNTLIKRMPPIRFNRQRREVAFVVDPLGRFWLPAPHNLWLASTASLAVTASGLMGSIEIGEWLRGARESFPFGFLLMHVGGFAFFFVYPPLYDLICRLCKRERRTVLVPWEDVVAVCGFNPNLGPGAVTGFGWNFALLPPDPERPGYTLPGAGIIVSVGGLPGALAQWEYIRRFMEEGVDATTTAAREWGVEWYDAYVAREKAECERTNDSARWRRFRRKRLWEHARFAHWYTEYRMKHILPKAVPRDWLAEWSKPLPKSQWAKPSQAVTELSEHLRAAYQRGEKFVEMGDIEKRFGVAAPTAVQAPYPSYPFRSKAERA
ncbi:hypothetical protein R3F64_16375 [Halomonas sp. 5021]|uniref:hypothetical protein n=1 Tax=unclassified Halomonas TaxID=2609666 RepID=UPI0018EFAC56|nr:hypothetical protein [Halomonas sp. A40-4]QPL46640.1 hypothetical protein IT895_02145 [Halomonas sp. A40-4]